MRLVALLGARNGHTAIFPLDAHRVPLHAFPIHPYEFEDGVFVVAAHPPELVGYELVGVAGVPIEELNKVVTPLVAHDNQWTICGRRPTFVVCVEVLLGLGMLDRAGRATFALLGPAGQRREIELEPVFAREFQARLGGGDTLPRRPAPAYLSRRDEPRWVELVGDGRAVHVAYNVTRGETAAFSRELETLAQGRTVELVVLDLRHNGGGDNRTYAPLLDALERLSAEGGKRLTILTSRTTFSAAMQLVVDLEQRTPAIFVGEPTGGSPNQYGDAVEIDLPESGLTVHVATIAWMTAGAADERLARDPDVPAPLESSAFFGGRDPVLEAALGVLA
jgi:hypothetical protein